MSRIPRVVIEGIPHHITQRGNGRQIVFDSDEGRRVYLDLLRRNANRFELAVWAYCLMSNHVHVMAVPRRADSMARALGRTHAEYALYLNTCRGVSGHLWQARYFSCPLGNEHVWRTMAYIERNPVRAGIVARATEYQWSSAAARVREMNLGGLLDLQMWRERYDGPTWAEILDRPSDEEAFRKRLHEATGRGRPCCDCETRKAFERHLKRDLAPKRPGWPAQKPKPGKPGTVHSNPLTYNRRVNG